MKIKLMHIGIIIATFGLLFNVIESLYFGMGTLKGFNEAPRSMGEFICDAIALSVIMFGWYLVICKLFKR